MSVGEIIGALMAGLFAIAFAAWARRLDKALDLLERIQKEMHDAAMVTERRLTRLEGIVERRGHNHGRAFEEYDDS